MDHVIDNIKTFLDIEIQDLKEQSESGHYKKLQDCPSFAPSKALVEAIQTLEKYYYGEKCTLDVNKLIES